MIDGIKIDLPNLNGKEWLSNDHLNFGTYLSVKTGELKDGTQTALYRGLTFIITASKKHTDLYYCSVRGSLHKYHNQGETNANDFNFDQLQAVIFDLSQKFDIDPKQAILRNLEIGVNIHTKQTAKSIINNLVAINGDPYTDFSIERKKAGKGIGKTDYKIKIYDKGKQENIPDKNILRIEVAVKRMQYLTKFGIAKLADLLQLQKVRPLGLLLQNFWCDSIYYDKAVQWRGMTAFEQKKILYYSTPRNWSDFDRKQRLRAKQHFKKLIANYGTTSTHADTGNLIAQKWHNLTAEKCTRFYHDFKETESKDLSTICPLEYTVKSYPNHQKSINIKKGSITPEKNTMIIGKENTTEKGAFCRTCEKDISQKRSTALYCSKRCNNSYHAKMRKRERHKRKKVETQLLKKLTVNLYQSHLSMTVEYRTPSGTYADRLEQREVRTSKNWIRCIIKVVIAQDPAPLVLTSYRAKKLIRKINILNNEPWGN